MKLIYCLMILLWPFASIAQTIKPLNIGDTVPDIKITNVYNYPSSTIRLSDLKGKLVILDFWSTWCGSCIEAIPKMEKLQKEFGDKIKIILVNVFPHDDINKVQLFFAKRKARTGLDVEMPYSLLQSSLATYFPFRFVPHYVWIQNGKVLATTSQFEISKQNILAVLDGENIDLHIKADNIGFDRNKPLFMNGNGGDGNQFIFRSILTGYKEGLGGSTGIQTDSSGKMIRLYVINYSLNSILRIAYPKIFNECAANQVIVGNNVTVPFLKKETNAVQSRYTNSYCYDISTPSVSINEMLQYFREDIYRSLHLKVTSQKRLVKCLILLNNSKINYQKLITNEGNSPLKTDPLQTVSSFTKELNEHAAFRDLHVINEISAGKMTSVNVPGAAAGLNEMKAFLRMQGFNFREENRLIDVAVINGN